MNWPARIKDKGGLRSQFHHAIDVVPTILEVASIDEPLIVNSIPQKPIEGVSMVYTWDDAKADSHRKTQYFEMFGNRALYHQRSGGHLPRRPTAVGDLRLGVVR